MTFNPNAQLDTSRARRGSGAGRAVAIGGGSALLVAILSLLGINLNNGNQAAQTTSEQTALAQECRTGADANTKVDCRMVAAQNSLDSYWGTVFANSGASYRPPYLNIEYSQSWNTACGAADQSVGPFYCPGDETVYVGPVFFEDVLQDQLGAADTPLTQMYVVAHEWGHHIQNLTGIMAQTRQGDTGPTSDSVRLELQADCFAGAWVASAQKTTDADGNVLVQPFSQEDLRDALEAAAAVGDDHIQARSGYVNPDTFSHGSSEQRQRWFTNGHQNGPSKCDTFSVSDLG